jgi:D-sedoheptulose 7-phosphate isomerase
MSVTNIINQHIATIQEMAVRNSADIEKFAAMCCKALKDGHVIYFAGNGGSAADSQHLAAELVGRFQKERRGLPSVALTTDTSILTAIGNDYGYEQIFSRQVEALVKKGDVVVGISTSGNSPNIVNALMKAKTLGALTVGMTGQGDGKMDTLCDLCIKVPAKVAARVQEAHILIGHTVCELIEEEVENV